MLASNGARALLFMKTIIYRLRDKATGFYTSTRPWTRRCDCVQAIQFKPDPENFEVEELDIRRRHIMGALDFLQRKPTRIPSKPTRPLPDLEARAADPVDKQDSQPIPQTGVQVEIATQQDAESTTA